MKLIRWLLSNIILIIFVLALTYAYVYWDNLTGEDTPLGKAIAYLSVEYDEVREFLDDYDLGDGKADRVTEAEPATEVVETASVPQAMPPSRPVPAPSSAPVLEQRRVPEQQVTRTPVPQAAPQPMAASRPPVPPTAMVQQPPAAPPAPAPAVQPEPEPAQPAAPAQKSEAEIRQLWIGARQEYHRGNVQQSIANYQQVIASSSDNYDAYGELGNVYLSRGQYQEAAGAYYEAGVILVKLGQTRRARSLLPILERLDRARAQELNQLMMAPRS